MLIKDKKMILYYLIYFKILEIEKLINKIYNY